MTDTRAGMSGPDTARLVLFDERIPGTRRLGTFLFVLLLIVVFVIGSRDIFISAITLIVGGWMLVHRFVLGLRLRARRADRVELAPRASAFRLGAQARGDRPRRCDLGQGDYYDRFSSRRDSKRPNWVIMPGIR